MNLKDYTDFCLSKINSRVICSKPQVLTNSDTSEKLYFYDPRVGEKFIFIGFVCGLDDYSIILQEYDNFACSLDDGVEIISFDDFNNYFIFSSQLVNDAKQSQRLRSNN